MFFCLCAVAPAVSMVDNKIKLYSPEDSSKVENVPIQVTTIRLTKDNYLQWSAVITIGIARRGRIGYITGRKIPPAEIDPTLDTWYLEDNQVKI